MRALLLFFLAFVAAAASDVIVDVVVFVAVATIATAAASTFAHCLFNVLKGLARIARNSFAIHSLFSSLSLLLYFSSGRFSHPPHRAERHGGTLRRQGT